MGGLLERKTCWSTLSTQILGRFGVVKGFVHSATFERVLAGTAVARKHSAVSRVLSLTICNRAREVLASITSPACANFNPKTPEKTSAAPQRECGVVRSDCAEFCLHWSLLGRAHQEPIGRSTCRVSRYGGARTAPSSEEHVLTA
eukprot:3026554-Amphidinium_carterae.1